MSSTLTDNQLKNIHLTLGDTEHIADELAKLQDTYKTAIKSMEGYKKQQDSEMSRQKQTNWELEHQTKRRTEYDAQVVKMTKDIAALRSHLPMIRESCFTIIVYHKNVKSTMMCFYTFMCSCCSLLFSLATDNGCRHCTPGWILMNSVCYYFSFSDKMASWKNAREFCQMYGGDLVVIDSKDKEVHNQY